MLGRNKGILYCIALHCIALHCIALYCIVLYCIVLYYFSIESDVENMFGGAYFGLNPAGSSDSCSSAFPFILLSMTIRITLSVISH